MATGSRDGNAVLPHKFDSYRYRQLVIVLISLFVVQSIGGQRLGADIAFAVLLVDAVLVSTDRGRVHKRFGWAAAILAAIGLGTRAFCIANPEFNQILQPFSLACAAITFFLVPGLILSSVFRAKVVDIEQVAAAVSAYLLYSMAFSMVFSFIVSVDPASFGFPAGTDHTDWRQRNILMAYFSLVTMTTLGYGDIIPRSGVARSLSAIVAVLGQMYMAVIVAWLVSNMRSKRDA